MNARTPSSMLLPVKTVKRKKETTPAAAPSIAAPVPAPAPALIQDEELSNYMLLAGMGKLRLDQLMYKCDALQVEKRAIESAHLYRQWIEHSDDSQKYLALFNYGSVLQTLGMADLAEEAYRLCVATEPKLAQAHINLGLVLERKGQNQQALDQWSNVVAQSLVNPTSDKLMEVTALNHIGRVYENLKQYEMAEQALRRSLQIDPKQSGVIQHWVHIRQKACMWPVYQSLPNVSANDMLMSTSPLAMLSLHDDPVIQLLSAHAFVGRTYSFNEEFLSKDKHYKHKRIRLGYLSGDLCTHAVGLLMADFLEAHDKSKFEIYAFDYSPEDGTPYRARLKQAFEHFHPVGTLTDREVAELVLANEIDVLIDMHGLSSGARPGICALHPAPLQGTYLGFIGTTAMPWLDFVVADRHVLPEELTPYFTEKPLYLDGSFLPLNKNMADITPITRAQVGLPEDAFVMAAFGNVYKINEDLLGAWANILKQAPRAVLWLMDDNEKTTAELKRKLKQIGVAAHQVQFSPRTSYQEYLARLHVADVFLDSYPYNCGSTTHDVLNCSLPMVTLSGKTMVSRMGRSMLSSLGLQELIANSFSEYVDITLKIAKDSDYQKELVKSVKSSMLRKQKNPKLLTASLENQIQSLIHKNS